MTLPGPLNKSWPRSTGGDAGAYSSFWHEQIVAFPPFSPFAVEGKSSLVPLAEANFANAESLSLTPINPQCRVIGSTGIVWGHMSLAVKPKDGPLSATFARFTFIFAKTDGKWQEGGHSRLAAPVRQLTLVGGKGETCRPVA